MTRPKGTLIRNPTLTRINHWITAACFVLLMLSGLSMFDPMLFWLSNLFGGGQSTRAIHPWIGIDCYQLRWHRHRVLARQPMEQGRSCLDAGD